MHPADHQPMLVKRTETVVVQGAHDLRALTGSQASGAVSHIFPGPSLNLLETTMCQLVQSLPKIGPLDQGVVEKKTITAVIGTSLASEG